MWDLSQDVIVQKKFISNAMSDWINALTLYGNHLFSASRDGSIIDYTLFLQ